MRSDSYAPDVSELAGHRRPHESVFGATTSCRAWAGPSRERLWGIQKHSHRASRGGKQRREM